VRDFLGHHRIPLYAVSADAKTFGWGLGMRHFIIGAAMLVIGLVVTFGAASVLQGMAEANRTVTAEPFTIEIRPDASANRGLRNEPAARSVSLASRRTAGL
jgi:hypothetical protein